MVNRLTLVISEIESSSPGFDGTLRAMEVGMASEFEAEEDVGVGMDEDWLSWLGATKDRCSRKVGIEDVLGTKEDGCEGGQEF